MKFLPWQISSNHQYFPKGSFCYKKQNEKIQHKIKVEHKKIIYFSTKLRKLVAFIQNKRKLINYML